MSNKTIEDEIKKLARDEGADLVGICSASSIDDKKFSDPTYLLPGAQSVICIAVKMDDEIVKDYLSKKEYLPFCHEEGHLDKKLKSIAEKIKLFLEERGNKAYNCDVNFNYRFTKNMKSNPESVISSFTNLVNLINKEKDESEILSKKEEKTLSRLRKMLIPGIKRTPMDLEPNFSHRCAAVASGLGRVGFSGNVITEKYGARVIFNSVITDAVLKSDDPLEKNPCIGCKLCEKSCQGGFFARDETQEIEIAGIKETIAKRNNYAYCIAICTGMSGQNKFKEWSTYSPYRFDDIDKLPLDDSVVEYVQTMFAKALEKGGKEAKNVLRLVSNSYLGRNDKLAEDFRQTCGFCQLVCAPDIKNKKESYQAIVESGSIEE
jgi:epoxyqueuosine reductase QueG